MKYMKAFELSKDKKEFMERARRMSSKASKSNFERRYAECQMVKKYMNQRTQEIVELLAFKHAAPSSIEAIRNHYRINFERVKKEKPTEYGFNFDLFKEESKSKKQDPLDFLPRHKQIKLKDILTFSHKVKKPIPTSLLFAEGFGLEEVEKLKEKGLL